MKICTFCGCKTDNNNKVCASCGGNTFKYICQNCNEEFDGLYCPSCGTRFNAVEKICPNCSTKYFSDACPKCGTVMRNNQNGGFTLKTRYGNSSMGVGAMILSVFGICFFGMGIIFSIVALVMASKVDKSNPSEMKVAKTAKIISIIGLAINGLIILFYLILIIIGLVTGSIG